MSNSEINQDETTGQTVSGLGKFISRRGFLKVTGLTAITGFVPSITLAQDIADKVVIAAPSSNEPWAIAVASPILKQALDELKHVFAFDLEAHRFLIVAEEDSSVSIKLTASESPSPRMGADLICTIDKDKGTLVSVQYIVGSCQDASLEIYSSLLDEKSVMLTDVQMRYGIIEFPGPRADQTWSFPRPAETIPPLPTDIPLEGWPVEDEKSCAWHYRGIGAVEWLKSPVGVFSFGVEVLEQKSCSTDDIQRFALTRPVIEEVAR